MLEDAAEVDELENARLLLHCLVKRFLVKECFYIIFRGALRIAPIIFDFVFLPSCLLLIMQRVAEKKDESGDYEAKSDHLDLVRQIDVVVLVEDQFTFNRLLPRQHNILRELVHLVYIKI